MGLGRAMRTLAIDCATDACSVALFEGEALIANDYRVLGRGHAEALVPMIAALPGRGRAQRILVALGPGSFTGVRIGMATAQALAIAWSADVAGYPTMALVAAMALERTGASAVTVSMRGGHGELFIADYAAGPVETVPLASLTPQAAAARGSKPLIAGNAVAAFGEQLAEGHQVLELLPDAARALLLPPALLTARIAPIYGRGPDARLPA